MNPIVSQMLDTTTERDLEILNLEETFKDDCKCEFKHIGSVCSVEVVSRVSSCYASILCCRVSTERTEKMISNAHVRCDRCGRLASQCWKVVPV